MSSAGHLRFQSLTVSSFERFRNFSWVLAEARGPVQEEEEACLAFFTFLVRPSQNRHAETARWV